MKSSTELGLRSNELSVGMRRYHIIDFLTGNTLSNKVRERLEKKWGTSDLAGYAKHVQDDAWNKAWTTYTAYNATESVQRLIVDDIIEALAEVSWGQHNE